ncbi:hypothetical protein ACW5R3_09560 [Bizionia sp. KMM 8389]
MKKITLLTLLTISLFACKNDAKDANSQTQEPNETVEETVLTEVNPFVNAIETVHQKEAFLNESAVQFQLAVSFGGNEILNALTTLSTDSTEGKFEMSNGDVIIYKKDQVFYSPSIKNTERVRFNAYTWSYFFLFPYKLSDAGTVWESYPNSQLGDVDYNVEKLSFEGDLGDTPDDWYVVYANKNSNLLEVAAYIVTAGKTTEEAEADPHAIKYEDFASVNNIPFARHWTFWGWETELGLTKQIGEANLSDIKFIDSDNAFEVPAHYLKID